MKRVLISLSILLTALLPLTALAQDDPYDQLIANYREALASNDKALIAVNWKRINADPQALAYIKENYPLMASSLRWTGMSLRLSGYLTDYRNNYPGGEITFENSRTPPPVTPLADNEAAALRFPNENQTPNDLAVYRSLQTPFRDNGSRALEYPNQNEPANQIIIRNRVDRLIQTGQ
jgi:hypothetical protein